MTNDSTKTDVATPIQLAAQFLYQWYTSPLQAPLVSEQGLAALQRIAGSPITAADLFQYKTKLNHSDSYAATRQKIVEKWDDRMNADSLPCENQALAFVLEFFNGMDHANFYRDGITANVTRIERGVVRYTDMRFPGNMPCWTLHLTVAGKALFLNDQMELEVGPGDMMLFHPDANYHYGLHPGAENWEHLWVLFQPRPHWQEWLEWNKLDEHILHLGLPDTKSLATLEQIFRGLIALNNDPSAYRGDLQQTRLEEMLIRARAYCSQPHGTVTDSRIQNACDYMQARLAQRVSIDEVAEACNLSPSRLSHLFRRQMGVSPKFWSNNIRLQKARKLLLSTDASVATIARQVGYEDPNQFTKYFKKNLGCSPREFRQSFVPTSTTQFVGVY